MRELTYLSFMCSSHQDISNIHKVFKRDIETSFTHKLHQIFSAHSAEHCTSHFSVKDNQMGLFDGRVSEEHNISLVWVKYNFMI